MLILDQMYFSCYPNSPSPVCCLSVRNFFQKRLIKFDSFHDASKIVRKWRSRIFYHLALYEQGGSKMGQAGGEDFDFRFWFCHLIFLSRMKDYYHFQLKPHNPISDKILVLELYSRWIRFQDSSKCNISIKVLAWPKC